MTNEPPVPGEGEVISEALGETSGGTNSNSEMEAIKRQMQELQQAMLAQQNMLSQQLIPWQFASTMFMGPGEGRGASWQRPPGSQSFARAEGQGVPLGAGGQGQTSPKSSRVIE